MGRDIVLFFAALLTALTAGRAFWVTLGESPFNMSGATYVEFFQQLDARIAIPLAVTGIGGTVMTGLAAARIGPTDEPVVSWLRRARLVWSEA